MNFRRLYHLLEEGNKTRYFREFFKEFENDPIWKEPIKAWIEGLVSFLPKTQVHVYLLLKLKEIIADESEKVKEFRVQYPERDIDWRSVIRYVGNRFNGIRERFQHYYSLDIPEIDRYRLSKKMSVNQVLDDFYEYEQAWINRKSKDKEWIDVTKDLQEGNIRILKKYPDGGAWFDLMRSACRKEGEAMGHCGNMAAYTHNDTILSYRKIKNGKKGVVLARPSLTFILNKQTRALGEMKGRGNQEPSSDYHDVIIDLLTMKDGNGNWLVSKLQGGGYAPENNFSLNDLSKEKWRKLMSLRGDDFGGVEWVIESEGVNEESKIKIQNKIFAWIKPALERKSLVSSPNDIQLKRFPYEDISFNEDMTSILVPTGRSSYDFMDVFHSSNWPKNFRRWETNMDEQEFDTYYDMSFGDVRDWFLSVVMDKRISKRFDKWLDFMVEGSDDERWKTMDWEKQVEELLHRDGELEDEVREAIRMGYESAVWQDFVSTWEEGLSDLVLHSNIDLPKIDVVVDDHKVFLRMTPKEFDYISSECADLTEYFSVIDSFDGDMPDWDSSNVSADEEVVYKALEEELLHRIQKDEKYYGMDAEQK